jgi:hypothetical protein
VKSLSQQAKIASSPERTKKAKKNERSGIVISIFGLLLTIFAFLWPITIRVMFGSPVFIISFFVGIFGGILTIVLGLSIIVYYAIEGGVLARQQKNGEGNPDMLSCAG